MGDEERPRGAVEPVADDLDVDDALAELGLDPDELDVVLGELEGAVPGDFGALLDVPDGFAERVTDQTWQRIRDRQSLRAFGDLFGLGWHTARAMLDGREEPGNGR